MTEINGDTSDGFHTFNELYEHRTALFAAVCRMVPAWSWRSHRHHEGGDPMFLGFFIAGVDLPSGAISYHVEDQYWDLFDGCPTLEYAPAWDGHTSKDVMARLNAWSGSTLKVKR